MHSNWLIISLEESTLENKLDKDLLLTFKDNGDQAETFWLNQEGKIYYNRIATKDLENCITFKY